MADSTDLVTQDCDRLVHPLPFKGDDRARWFSELKDVLQQEAARMRAELRVNGIGYIHGVALEDLFNPLVHNLAWTKDATDTPREPCDQKTASTTPPH